MTVADLKSLVSDPPQREVRVPMTQQEFNESIGELRAEWVDGEAIIMAPENFEHSDLADWLTMILRGFVRQKDLGEIITRNFLSRLPTGTLRVPDVFFVTKSREHLIRPTLLAGPPDLAIEIVSPDSVSRDYREKYDEYQHAGVREYWIIDPRNERVEAFILTDNTYKPILETEGKLPSTVLPNFYLKPAWLWQSPRPLELAILKELGVTA